LSAEYGIRPFKHDVCCVNYLKHQKYGNAMTVKITLKGNLEFGTSKTYETMLKTLLQKLEVYYKHDYLLKSEDYFQAETFNIVVPRLIVPICAEKTWRNTVGFLRDAAQFAVAGKMSLWVCNDKNEVLQRHIIEPTNEKLVVKAYLVGANAVKARDYDLAITAFDDTLDKFAGNSYAYDLRGYARFKLGMLGDAALDFTKSIELFPTAEAFFGRGKVQMTMSNLEGAIGDLKSAIEQSVPLQPIFWQSRRVKGECHLRLKQYDKAIFELQFVSKRNFSTEDPNFKHRKRTWELYGEALLAAGQRANADKAFAEATKLSKDEVGGGKVPVSNSTRRTVLKS
jgi:tetratricopeptide (TPR) repeat protein